MLCLRGCKPSQRHMVSPVVPQMSTEVPRVQEPGGTGGDWEVEEGWLHALSQSPCPDPVAWQAPAVPGAVSKLGRPPAHTYRMAVVGRHCGHPGWQTCAAGTLGQREGLL